MKKTFLKFLVFAWVLGGCYLISQQVFSLSKSFDLKSLVFLGIQIFIGICSLFYWRTLSGGVEEEDKTKLGRIHQVVETFDIFIPTLDESRDLLATTIDASLKVRLRNNVYVLDDGDRSWLKELCKIKDVKYISRPSKTDGKAGNLNHALSLIDSTYVLILDADVIPKEDILEFAHPHFDSPDVCIVQFPHEFYNLDSFLHWNFNDEWTDLSLSMKKVNPCRNTFKASCWIGSPSILRVKSIKDMGGVCTSSVTEDVQTTIKVMANGHWVKSLKEAKARGLGPEDFTSFCIQRQRWAKGFFHLWWSEESPLRKNLSGLVKFEWVGDFFYYIHLSFYLFLLQIFPIWCAFDQRFNLLNETHETTLLFLVLYCGMYLLNKLLAGPSYRIFPTQVYMRLGMFPVILGFFESFRTSDNFFEVTPKEKVKKTNLRTRAFCSGLLVLLLGNLLSIMQLLHRGAFDGGGILLICWSLSNLAFLSIAFRKILFHQGYVPLKWEATTASWSS